MLIVAKEAEEDIKTAYEWYEEQRPHLGNIFVSEIDSKLREIEERPDLHMEAMGNVRRALCKKFPYSIYFIHENKNIVVIAVLHQRRNPAIWETRKKTESG